MFPFLYQSLLIQERCFLGSWNLRGNELLLDRGCIEEEEEGGGKILSVELVLPGEIEKE